jgi:hypothetical protein
MEQDNESYEQAPAPAEAGAESQQNEESAEGTGSRRHGLFPALLSGALGALLVGGGAYWKYGPPNELVEMVSRWGLTPNYAFAGGIVFLVLAVFVSMLGRRASQIEDLEYQLSIVEERTAGSESVAGRVGPAIDSLGAGLDGVRTQVEHLAALVSGVESKLHMGERQNITTVAAVDSLAAKVDRFQRDLGNTKNVPAVADELAPLARLLDSLGRDQHARAARQLEAIEEVQDTLAAMEGRMRERMDAMSSSKGGSDDVVAKMKGSSDEIVAKITTAMSQLRERLEGSLTQLPKQVGEGLAGMPAHVDRMGEGLSKKVAMVGDGIARRVDEAIESLAKRMEEAAKSNRVQSVAATSPSRVDSGAPNTPSGTPASALPSADSTVDSSGFAEGPRETKTVLHSIDKLRALRGNP